MIRVIFVCMGNICRSPMAEAIFADLTQKADLGDHFEIDSAGTSGYHVGQVACQGTREVLAQRNIAYTGRSQKITRSDLNRFDYVVAMDSENLSNLQHLDRRGTHRHKFHKILDFASLTTARDVPDPYYVGRFEYVYDLLLDGCQGLLAHIRANHNL